ncbi:MAG: hypothetical protein H6765_10085 [Candidatus Peribacteria bacterium]|nr:MAG: hypothetical protein H6765_10085 [Candidatus Peribacteria bacterium]
MAGGDDRKACAAACSYCEMYDRFVGKIAFANPLAQNIWTKTLQNLYNKWIGEQVKKEVIISDTDDTNKIVRIEKDTVITSLDGEIVDVD